MSAFASGLRGNASRGNLLPGYGQSSVGFGGLAGEHKACRIGLQRKVLKSMDESIAIVSGLPRSGTSMMMKMLHAGGIEPIKDGLREADVDNPNGYYEFERAKKIKEDRGWLPDARGKVVKMVSMLLFDLPEDHHYKVVFMRRNMDEILTSQSKMLDRLGTPSGIPNDQMAALFGKHLAKITNWLANRPNIKTLYLQYDEVLADPARTAAELNRFFGGLLDEQAMASVVDPSLYRNKKGLPS